MKLTLYRHHSPTEKHIQLNPVKLPFHELIILLKGNLHYVVNDQDVFLHDRDMMLVPMGAVRSRFSSNEQNDYLSIHLLIDEPLPLPLKISEGVRACIATLISSADQMWNEFFPDHEPLIENIIRAILDYTLTRLNTKPESQLVQDLRNFMLKNLHRKLTVAEFAAQALLSVSYCSAVFKRETGIPIMSYFTQMRMQEAKTQLIIKTHSLTEIAESLGYDDYNLFSRTFKKHFGLTPSRFRDKFSI